MSQTQNSRLLFLALSTLFALNCLVSMPAKASSTTDASLTDTYWKLTEINEQPVLPGAEKKELHMVLTSEGNNVRGFSGCNRFMGSYKEENNTIQFGPLAGTMMACVGGMEQEYSFLKALESSEHFSISGEELMFYNSGDQLILRFKSVYL